MSQAHPPRLIAAVEEFDSILAQLDEAGATSALGERLRRLLGALRSAMNWLEDTSYFEEAHALMDRAGRLARMHFADDCHLTFEGDSYFMECPVALAHNRVGMSPGMRVVQSECSICGLDPDDCMHITGREYEGHTCYRRITEVDLLEISLVGRPAQPDARIMKMSVDERDIRQALGSQYERGVPVLCDRCLSKCAGVVRPFEGHSHTVTKGN